MTHAEFQKAYAEGAIRVEIDSAGAARYVSARLLLPFVTMPVIGAGVALALVGWLWSGLGIVALGIVTPRLIKRSAPHFVMTQALEDERIYGEVMQRKILRVLPAG